MRWTLSGAGPRWPVAEFRTLRDALGVRRGCRAGARHLGVVITIRRT